MATKRKNRYESLLVSCDSNAPEVQYEKDTTVSSHPAETVRIFTARVDGVWVFGYQVHWANGQSSFRLPTKQIGMFRSEQDALLYGVGYMLSFRDYFKEDTVFNLREAERRFNVPSLPLFP